LLMSLAPPSLFNNRVRFRHGRSRPAINRQAIKQRPVLVFKKITR
jgi:hypothetical protein